jgi:predicted glycoside hydrolase/deacetylase ChbG (UPF0249 family)
MPATLAERLGFAASDRIAVIHCDDIGMCHASNVGAFEALERGPATCGSVMVPCPWFFEAAEIARAHPELDLGVHLTLNSEWPGYRWGPVTGASAVPSLVDGQGCFPRTTVEVLQNARYEEVASEVRAQVERALDAGIDVTHLDAHMGTALFPPFHDIYATLARDYRLPVFASRPDASTLAGMGLEGAAQLLEEVVRSLEEAGIPVFDGFDADSLGFEDGEGEAHNTRRLAALGPGVHYLICHPAQGGEELAAIAPDAHARDFERRFYGSEAGRRILEAEGIRTIGMRPLRDLVRRNGDGG